MAKIEIPETKRSFVINSEHADMIVNDLLQGDYEALGRIFTDLVNFNLGYNEDLKDAPCEDKAERTARKLLKTDSEHYIRNWIGRSEQNSKNRTSGQYPNNDEVRNYAISKGYDPNIAVGWAIERAQNNWCDEQGQPIKYWKKCLDSYMQGVNRKKIEDLTRNIGRR